jgi:hypothetical protein
MLIVQFHGLIERYILGLQESDQAEMIGLNVRLFNEFKW